MDVEQLKRLQAEHKDPWKGLAAIAGISPDKMSKVRKGTRRLTLEEGNRLRRYYGLKEEAASDRPVQLPIVGLVSAGMWREGFEQVMGYMPKPDRSLSDDSFVVIVEGDSMDKLAGPGTAVIVDPHDLSLVNGKAYVVRNMDGDAVFKRYFENPARLEPCSNNPAHPTIYPGQDHFTVIGRVRKKVEDL